MTEEESYRRLLRETLDKDERLEVSLPYGVRSCFADIFCPATNSCVSVRFMNGEMRFWDFVDDGKNDGFGVELSDCGLKELIKKLYEVFSGGFKIIPYLRDVVCNAYFKMLFYPNATDESIIAVFRQLCADGRFNGADRIKAFNFFGDRIFLFKVNVNKLERVGY